MVAAGLLAKKAVERGLTSQPWVKTSLAPGSKVVTDYLADADLTQYLDQLGFNLVGYGCTTCIGNSGPLPGRFRKPSRRAGSSCARCSAAIATSRAASSPRYARTTWRRRRWWSPTRWPAAWTSTCTTSRSARTGRDAPCFCATSGPRSTRSSTRGQQVGATRRCSSAQYAHVFDGDDAWRALPVPESRPLRMGRRLHLHQATRPTSTACRMSRPPLPTSAGARVLAVLGDSITTDHISPAGSIKKDSPAGRYLLEHGVRSEGLQLLRFAPRQSRSDDARNLRQRAPAQSARSRTSRAASPRICRAASA